LTPGWSSESGLPGAFGLPALKAIFKLIRP
jgi:hypothetical protein